MGGNFDRIYNFLVADKAVIVHVTCCLASTRRSCIMHELSISSRSRNAGTEHLETIFIVLQRGQEKWTTRVK